MTDRRLAEHFGRKLWLCRRRAGLSQQRLAELTEMHRPDISLLENGPRLPRLDTILKVSAGVEVSPCELLVGLRWRPGYYLEGDFDVEERDGPAGAEWPGRR